MTALQGVPAVLFIVFKTIFNIDYNNLFFASINPFHFLYVFLFRLTPYFLFLE